MGCCRGQIGKSFQGKKSSQNDTGDCKTLEDGGARTVIRVLATDKGLRLVIATLNNGFVNLGSFASTFRCSGPTAMLLQRYVPDIQRALAQEPASFSPYRSGISITELIRLSETILRRSPKHVVGASG